MRTSTFRLRGLVPPLVTPLSGPAEIDAAGLGRLIEHVLAGGVHGLFLLGTTGEGPSLPQAVRHQLVAMACDQVAGRVPVLVGISDTSWSDSLALAEAAYAAGASAVVAAPPYYFSATQPELLRWYRDLADASPLPLVLYNMPSHTKLVIELATLTALAGHENIMGLKDSSGDLAYFREACRSLPPDFPVLIGPEELLLPALRAGGAGGVCGGANLEPRSYVALYEAWQAEDEAAAARRQQRVAALGEALYTVGESPGRIIQGLKTALDMLGICSPLLAPPFAAHSAEERRTIAGRLIGLGIPHAQPQPVEA